MQNINAVVIDDEVNNAELLVHFLQKYCPLINIAGVAYTQATASTLIKESQPQLIFLDIILDEGTGFDLLNNIEDDQIKIIFVTAFDEYAIKAFKYNAIDYILKPVQIEDLVIAVNSAVQDIQSNTFTTKQQLSISSESIDSQQVDFIAIPSIKKIDFIKVNDIVYCKSDGRYTSFHLVDRKKILATKNLGEYENIFTGNTFFRVHHSYIINLNHVQKLNKSAGNYCEMTTGESIPVAKRRHDQLLKFLGLR